jgi:uncharacterized coiled-coil protein SlyX
MRRPNLVEFLIVLAIVGTLVGLLLPATQASREAARRTQYENDMRTMAIEGEYSKGMNGQQGGGEPGSGFAGERYAVALQVDDTGAVVDGGEDGARRIIYEAQLALVVDDLSHVEAAIVRLLEQHDGYVADSSVTGRQGEQLTGRWQVRVPVDRFQAFLAAAAKLGVAENRQQTAQDVSEEFVDLGARIANSKRLEARIVELLDSASGKITDVIEVEQQLARVRGEIEQMEGRLRYLTNRTDLTTVTITAREERDYVPPAAPTFATRVHDAWGNSLDALRSFGENVGLAIVAATPWVAILAVVVGPALWWNRRRARDSAARGGATGSDPR